VTDTADLLTADDLAVIFKVSRRRIIEWANQYQWPRVKLGKTYRWTPEQVEQIKARHSVTPAGIKPADGRTARSARKAS